MIMKKVIRSKKVILVCSIILICLATVSIRKIFASLTPVKSVVITSEKSDYSKKEPGSWQVTKSAKWTSTGKARITFDLETVMKTVNDYTDIILVLDISGSMEGNKLNKVKSDAANLIDKLLENNKNRAAIITFESSSQIVDGLTNDKDKLIEDINKLEVAGGTNYYQALVNVDGVLDGYIKEDKRDVILLFLTDGSPTEDTPNEVGQYNYLKSQYPYLAINGIQYEMGKSVLDPIKKISDNQFIAEMSNLDNVLIEASTNPEKFDDFTITDYIDEEYFDVSNLKNINASIGEGKLEMDGSTPKITWKIGNDTLRTGQNAQLTIDAELNEKYLNKGGFYPTNKKEVITSSVPNISDEHIESTKTPVLADNYAVKYDANAPEGCQLGNVPADEKYSVFSTVNISDKRLECGNYQFKGWEIVNKDVSRINDDYFTMPEEDVVIRAKWGSLFLSKNMEGEVSEVQTLYSIMAEKAVPDNIKSEFVFSNTGINFEKLSSFANGTGVYELSSTKDDEYPVYYYRGAVSNNNVKFGGFCWKMVRTTSTGGVKLIYNGLPDTDGHCDNANAGSEIGKSYFNSRDSSPAYNGYMYGDVYSVAMGSFPFWYKLIGMDTSEIKIMNNGYMSNSDNYFYADSIRWDSENNSYVLENTDGSEVIQTIWEGNYSNLKGKYRCSNGGQTTCTTVYYIGNTDNYYTYYLSLGGGNNLADVNKELNFSKTIRYEDGKYIMEEPIVKIKKADWYTKYDNVGEGYYSCPDGSPSCESVYYLTRTSFRSATDSNYMRVVVMSEGATFDSLYEQARTVKWIYGNDVEWDGTNYKIDDVDRMESAPLDWNTDRINIGKSYRYTCLSTSDTCNSIYYINYTGISSSIYTITLSDGMKIEQAVQNMQTNTKDSTIKETIDTWYSNNMVEYTAYLEDTIWCNDRSMSNSNGWTKDGDANNYLYYGLYDGDSKPSLVCLNRNDSFTVSEENGNGALTYPVALLTSEEVMLAGGIRESSSSSIHNFYLQSYLSWWTLSPNRFENAFAYGSPLNTNGAFVYHAYGRTDENYGVRPAISIRSGMKVLGGNGTANNPYTLDLD